MSSPHQPPVNAMKVVAVGTGLWVIALIVVSLLSAFTSVGSAKAVWICITGVVLGGVAALDQLRRRRPGFIDNRPD